MPVINKHIFSIVGRLLHWKNVVSLKIKEFEYMYIFERHLLILYKDIFSILLMLQKERSVSQKIMLDKRCLAIKSIKHGRKKVVSLKKNVARAKG